MFKLLNNKEKLELKMDKLYIECIDEVLKSFMLFRRNSFYKIDSDAQTKYLNRK